MAFEAFPNYDNVETFRFMESRLNWCGFKDSTYGNDTCPSLACELSDETFVQVFVNYRNPALRELDGAPLVTVVWLDGNMWRDFDCPSAAAKLAIFLARA